MMFFASRNIVICVFINFIMQISLMFQMENILLSDQGNAFLYFHPESSKNGPSGGQQCLCNKSHSYTVVLNLYIVF